MTLNEARKHVGAGVVYRPHPDAQAEDGIITGVSDRWVFVRYAGDIGAKATDPGQLQLLAGA